jgi:hypothetical protein
MSNNRSRQWPDSGLRDLAQFNADQLRRVSDEIIKALKGAVDVFRATPGPDNPWGDIMRKSVDLVEVSATAFCDHAQKLAQADTPAECIRLQSEFVKLTVVALQKHSVGTLDAAQLTFGQRRKITE